jgi:hypothetical protein
MYMYIYICIRVFMLKLIALGTTKHTLDVNFENQIQFVLKKAFISEMTKKGKLYLRISLIRELNFRLLCRFSACGRTVLCAISAVHCL